MTDTEVTPVPEGTSEIRVLLVDDDALVRAGLSMMLNGAASLVIVLTTFDADENVLGALRAGASGFLLKDAPPAEIADAIRRVAAGDPILSPAVTRRLMRRAVVQENARERAGQQLAALSPRELEVVRAIAEGQTNAEIASSLLMSVPTVKAHVTHILTKAGLANRTQIALLAHDAGLA